MIVVQLFLAIAVCALFIRFVNRKKRLPPGIIFGAGRNWLEVKTFTKKIIREFGYGKVKVMDQSLVDSANQLTDSIKTLLLDSNDGTLAVKTSIFSVHVLNVIWTMVGGYKFDPNDERLIGNMKCLDKAVQVYGNTNLYNVLPFLRDWFPNLVQYPEHLKIHEEIHGFTKFLIADAKERRSQRLDSDPTSFIEVFLDKIEEHSGDSDTIYKEEQLEIILDDLLLGGLETSGTLLNWSILFMVLNPDVQNKVRQVILDKRTNQNFLFATELKRIPFVKATILEIFRCGNVAPTPPPRQATGDVHFRDYIIPKGTILFYNLDPIYNDKKLWKDPETFRPERFLNEKGEINQLASEKVSGTVFGFGPRTCFGESAGLYSIYTYFAALIVNFKFDVIPGQEPSVENYSTSFTRYPRIYRVKVTKLTT